MFTSRFFFFFLRKNIFHIHIKKLLRMATSMDPSFDDNIPSQLVAYMQKQDAESRQDTRSWAKLLDQPA